MGAKLKSKTHLQNRFFVVWIQSFKKVLIWPKIILKIIFYKNKKIYQKNAEFHADFKSIEKVLKKSTKKKLKAKQVWRTWVKVKKVHISVTFC